MISTFIGRQKELSLLEKEWQKKSGSLVVLYGRRRVGKTRLIMEFIEGKNGIFFIGEDSSPYIQINRLKEKIAEFLNDSLLNSLDLTDWDQLFGYLAKATVKDRYYLFIDEFSYLIKSDKTILGALQRYWDTTFSTSNICIILSGSMLGLMSDLVLSHASPLYGRRSREILLEGLPFADARHFLKMPYEEQLKIYMTIGGVPEYLLKASEYSCAKDFIENEFLDKFGYFYREPYFIISQEFREMRSYFSILDAISSGKTRPTHIADFAGISSRSIYPYLESLIRLGFIERRVSIGDNRKNGIYLIKDTIFDAWFNFVHKDKELIERGVAKLDDNALSRYCGKRFEHLVENELLFDLIPDIIKVDRWWHKSEEIDLIAFTECMDDVMDRAIFVECKWKSLKKGGSKKILLDLERKSELVRLKTSSQQKTFCLICRKTEGKDELRSEGYLVFDMDDL